MRPETSQPLPSLRSFESSRWNARRVALGFFPRVVNVERASRPTATDVVQTPSESRTANASDRSGQCKAHVPSKSPGSSPPQRPANLIIPRAEGEERLKKQLENGREIRNRKGWASVVAIDKALADGRIWHAVNKELLSQMFDTDSIAREYDWAVPVKRPAGAQEGSPAAKVNELYVTLDTRLEKLESILKRLPHIPEPTTGGAVAAATVSPRSTQTVSAASRKIFVVHGHDDAAKEAVARILERLDLKPVILHEQPNAGRTLIEKFEAYSDVGFAVVILTPDDVAYSKTKPEEIRDRPRQNVILELGFFIGKLGRARVCPMYKEGVELPADYDGVVYVALDAPGAWHLKLAREIKESGIDVDFNKL